MTTAQAEFTATDAGLPMASHGPWLTVGPSAHDRRLARGRIRSAPAMLGPAFVASVAIIALLALIVTGFLYETLRPGPSVSSTCRYSKQRSKSSDGG